MSTKTVKGTQRSSSANTMANAVAFLVEQILLERVNTAEIVKILSADAPGEAGPAGFANALPLVTQTDAWDNAILPATLFHLPWFRYQSGDAAFIVDPQPGDKALALAPKRDSSGVSTDTEEAVKPATFREFDQAGSFLIGGFQNKTPRKWIRIDPVSGDISVSTPNANVLVECRESGNIEIRTNGGNVTVHATGTATLDAPQTHVTGDMRVDGMLTVGKNLSVQGGGGGGSSFTGGFSNTGGAVTSNGVTLETHTHPGDSGGTTGAPNA